MSTESATESALTGRARSGAEWRDVGRHLQLEREPNRALEPAALIVVRAGGVDRFAAMQTAFRPEGVDVVWTGAR